MAHQASKRNTDGSPRLARLMKLSWSIQRRKRKSRSDALKAAWTICQNEDTAIEYLVRRLNHHKPVQRQEIERFSLFGG